MSSFISSEYQTLTAATAVLFMIYLGSWFLWTRESRKDAFRLGFGVALVFRKSDGTVWVASCLRNSPAQRAGIENFAQVISINGIEMKFSSDRDLWTWSNGHIPRQGRRSVWMVKTSEGKTKEASMFPELVPYEIPVYWDPNKESSLTNMGFRIPQAAAYCEKTGQYYSVLRIKSLRMRCFFE